MNDANTIRIIDNLRDVVSNAQVRLSKLPRPESFDAVLASQNANNHLKSTYEALTDLREIFLFEPVEATDE